MNTCVCSVVLWFNEHFYEPAALAELAKPAELDDGADADLIKGELVYC